MTWIDIYNDYKKKMPIFYNYVKNYQHLFNNISSKCNQILAVYFILLLEN